MLPRLAEHALLSVIDTEVFTAPWILIDSENMGAGSAHSLETAIQAVNKGKAATFAGTVRSGIVAIDIDIPNDDFTAFVIDCIRSLAQKFKAPSIAHASGGKGRSHVLICGGENVALLAQKVRDIANEMRLSSKEVDIRTTLRPITAPHRKRGHVEVTVPICEATQFLECVKKLPRELGFDTGPKIRIPQEIGQVVRENILGLKISASKTPKGGRSEAEFALTRALKNSGLKENQAWDEVSSIKGKSRSKGKDWWLRQMWDKVRPIAEQPEKQLKQIDASQVILPAIRCRWELLKVGTRHGHTLDSVIWAVGESLGQGPMHISERDIQLRTGFSRTTIRKALRELVAGGIFTRTAPTIPDAAAVIDVGKAVVGAPALTVPPALTPCALRWLPAAPPGTATHLASHFIPPATADRTPPSSRQRQLSASRAHAAAAVPHAPYVPVSTSPHWERIQAERDAYHGSIKQSREAWFVQRDATLRRHRYQPEKPNPATRRRSFSPPHSPLHTPIDELGLFLVSSAPSSREAAHHPPSTSFGQHVESGWCAADKGADETKRGECGGEKDQNPKNKTRHDSG